MKSLSVIIPSRTITNALACVKAVRQHEPTARIILVDDGLDLSGERGDYLTANTMIVKGVSPFIFSRNINIGIRAAIEAFDPWAFVLLNDDALLKTREGFSILQYAAEEHPEYGVIASTTNHVGNPNQLPKGIGLRDEKRMVCFIAVLIPRTTIDRVGFMDEDFDQYGGDDDCYCYQTRLAGLKIAVHDGCFVDHASLPSTFRKMTRTAVEKYGDGREIFRKKFGSYPL